MKSIRIKILHGYLFLAVLICINCTATKASIVLPSVFSDNMVLQQKTNAAIWGKADPNKMIQVSTTWSKQTYSAKADKQGNWKVKVATPSYGGPYVITIAGDHKINLKNVMIGEVWICSGQSNMEMPVVGWGSIKNFKEEIANAKYPKIRLLQVAHMTSNVPLNEAVIANNGSWMECNPENVGGFSAVAYFFAREIYKKTGIPIGLIHTSWGGTIAEAWTSGTTLKGMTDFAEAVKKIENAKEDKEGIEFKRKLEAWQKLLLEKDGGYDKGKPLWVSSSFDASSWGSLSVPALWEQSVLPDFDGVVWLRKQVVIPESFAGKDLKINLGMIDDDDVTFFDGEKIGETQGYNQLRSYTVPGNKVKAGKFTLAVRVFDFGGGGGIFGEKNVVSVVSANGQRISLDGQWQYKVAVNFKDIKPMPVLDNGPNRSTVLYNAMINPFIQFSIRGAIWYQGESNAGRAHQYEELFPAMIKDWRKKWGLGDFPFYFVQLANFMERQDQPGSSNWAELRDAQLKTLSLPNTGMSVTIDAGEALDIHPKNKQDVGKRLGLIALAKTYGYKIPYSGPMLQSYKIANQEVNLDFKFIDGGLKTRDGKEVKGFAVAGADQRFYWAKATIKANQIIISAPEVPNPVAVRYAWADNPDCNLYNGAGLPASPFRTDNWKESTYGNK